MFARLLELFGIRGFYQAMSRLAGERMLPGFAVDHAEGWSQNKLGHVKEGSRYFLIANVFRLTVYVVPALAAIHESAWIPLATMGILVLFHVLCIVLETYKHQLCRVHGRRLAEGDWPEMDEPDPPDIRLSSRSDWYYAPRRWETEGFYRVFGMALFQNLVTNYIENTRLTREDREAGKKLVFLKGKGKDNTLAFVRDTRVAESIHLCAFFVNTPLLIEGLVLGIKSFMWFIVPVLVLDLYLVLLQRYHRLRMWPMIVRARSADAGQA
jgi:hypothetical protein